MAVEHLLWTCSVGWQLQSASSVCSRIVFLFRTDCGFVPVMARSLDDASRGH